MGRGALAVYSRTINRGNSNPRGWGRDTCGDQNPGPSALYPNADNMCGDVYTLNLNPTPQTLNSLFSNLNPDPQLSNLNPKLSTLNLTRVPAGRERGGAAFLRW